MLFSVSTFWYQQQCLGLVTTYRMDFQVGQSLDGLSVGLCSTLFPCIYFRQEQFWDKNVRMISGLIPQSGTKPKSGYNLYSFSLLFIVHFSNIVPVGSWKPLVFLKSGTFCWILPVPHPPCHTTLYNFLIHLKFLSCMSFTCLISYPKTIYDIGRLLIFY